MTKLSLADYIGAVRRIEPDPAKAGKRVIRKGHLFGPDGNAGTRLCLFAIHSRLGGFHWLVQDAEQLDQITGLPSVIAQADDARTAYDSALKGL